MTPKTYQSICQSKYCIGGRFHKATFPHTDGLRGTAALLVVGFHLMEGYFPDFSLTPYAPRLPRRRFFPCFGFVD